jgi:hypothetical protein
MRKHLELKFDGFWTEKSIEKIPNKSGVYIVFDGLLDNDGTTVSLEKVLYVGASENCSGAVEGSDMWEKWHEGCGISNITDDNDIPTSSGEDNELFFSFAPIEGEDAQRAAAAITFEQSPTTNSDEEKAAFPYEDTKINLAGKTGILNTDYEIVMDYPDAPMDDDNRTDEFMDLDMK